MNVYPTISQPLSIAEARELDALVLAYVGDGVQSLYVRAYLAAQHGGRAGALHAMSIGKVSAVAQAEEVDAIRQLFTPEEDDVYRKARNHKSKSTAKNASVADYRKASGLEAVWGYLYLTGQNERLGQLLSLAHKFEEGV
jgi:ribonuclease-3 family protein